MRAQPSAQELLTPVLPLRLPRYVHHIELIVLSYEQCNQLLFLCQARPWRSPNRHQPKTKPINIRRGESGGERKGGPLWSPAGWGVIVLPQDWSKMNRYAGDHKGPPNPTSSALAPTDRSASWLTSRLRLMRIGQPRRSPNTHQPHQHPSSSNKDTTRCNQFSTAFIFRLTPLLSLVLVILLHNAPYCSPRILSILCHHS